MAVTKGDVMSEARCPLAAAIDNAMQRLPESRTLRLHLTRGEYSVSVTARNGRRVWFDGEIAQAIADAVEWLENEG